MTISLPTIDLRFKDQAWRTTAACAGTSTGWDPFYQDVGGSNRVAKSICAECPVETRLACLKFAFDNDERFGVWGGFSAEERQKLKKALAA